MIEYIDKSHCNNFPFLIHLIFITNKERTNVDRRPTRHRIGPGKSFSHSLFFYFSLNYHIVVIRIIVHVYIFDVVNLIPLQAPMLDRERGESESEKRRFDLKRYVPSALRPQDKNVRIN